MNRQFGGLALVIMLCLSVSLARGEPKEKSGEKTPSKEQQGQTSAQHKSEGKEGSSNPLGESKETSGTKPADNSALGGDWSERSHNGKQSNTQTSNQPTGAEGAAAANADNKNKTSQPTGAEGAAAANAANKNKLPQASGAEGAAAGAAAANNKNPQASGAEGAAAGAAAANNKNSQTTGAQGAAAGAAVANRNSPQHSGAQGAAAGAAAVNRNSPQYSGAQGAAAVANRNSPAMSGPVAVTAGYGAVQNSFHDPNIYGQQWYSSHPGAWAASGWAAGAAWQPSTWGSVAGLCGYGNATPISYDYGVNVTAQNGNVMVNGQNVGTTGEYSQQAANLAETGTEAQASITDQWLPLGVFAMVHDESQQPQYIVQMAINKQGILRGNYTDENSGNTLPIHGAADKNTQRVAWMIGDNKQAVMEAGLSDLTDSEAPALIHKNGKTDHWLLIRLAQSK
jgi:hypothetical protein